MAKIGFLYLIMICLCCVVNAQKIQPNPIPPQSSDGDIVDVLRIELVAIRVLVWDSKGKTYVKNLTSTDFEIREDDKLVAIEVFTKPDENSAAEELRNGYVLGIFPEDYKQKKWRNMRIKVKSPKGAQKLTVKAPKGYFY